MTKGCFPIPMSPRVPGAQCDLCGALGTIARITFTALVSRVYLLCASCWSSLRTDRDAIHALILDERTSTVASTSRHMAFFTESRFWDDVANFVDLIRVSDDEEWLMEKAREILDMAHDMVGPMPSMVADFVTKYTTVQ